MPNWLQFLISLFTSKPPIPMPSEASKQPVQPPTDPDALLPWTTFDNCRHNVRAIADLEGLSLQQKNDFSSTLHCESNYDNTIIMLNCVNAFVRSTNYDVTKHGKILSKDVGICQVNTYWHIGPGKDFSSEDYVQQNPEAVVHWAAHIFKTSPKTWVCYSKGMYTKYAA